ncbi:MAG: hypothetical protein CMJ19_07545 [Phycisphaeraceae bacterium]|nr:hypothetical protein [Phycisphaeraceae bacterium]
MKKLDLSNIQEGVRRAKLPKQTFEHLQESYEEITQALLKTLTIDPDEITILDGAVVTEDGQDYDVTAGWVAYQNEVFQVDVAAFTAPGGETAVWNIVTTYIAEDPIQYDDGSTHNTHPIRKMVLQSGVSGSGIKDWDEVRSLNSTGWLECPLASGAGGKLLYRKNIDNTVTIRSKLLGVGGVSNPFSLIATLPVGYRPFDGQAWIPIVARYSSQVFNYKLSISNTGEISIMNTLNDEPGNNAPDGDVYIPDFTFSLVPTPTS